MREALESQPLLLLFLVAAGGSLLGNLKLRGFSLGVTAVLFVGLGLSAWDPKLVLPDFVSQLGLVFFVYTVGIASGPSFFASLKKQAVRTLAVAVGGILLAAAVVTGAALALGFTHREAAGLFAGALTNTPALAAVVESLRTAGDSALSEPVVAYSVAYPMGVLGLLWAVHLAGRKWLKETGAQRDATAIITRTARVTKDDVIGKPAEALRKKEGWHVVLARLRRKGALHVVGDLTVFEKDDVVSVVGPAADVESVIAALGEPSADALEVDRSTVDVVRFFVSNHAQTGRKVEDVQDELDHRFGAQMTRLRRGDTEILPEDAGTLMPGDIARVLAPRAQMKAIAAYLGDSYRALGEMDVVTVGIGLCLGMLLGQVQVDLPGGVRFSLGMAGGPLIVGLVLGRLVRTGPFTWSMPHSANLTVRQLGLVLFFAGVGTRAGEAFFSAVTTWRGVALFLAGTVATCAAAFGMLVVGRRVTKLSGGALLGLVAGAHTQPAALAFALEQQQSDQPSLGYAQSFPVATIAKILVAQMLLALVR
ncbi:MAG: transporter [Myxococcota bacterium]